MGKAKRKHPDIDEILQRPWCYYCERDFDDLKILINHQKAKHFKCERCGRRLNTAGGLSVHMTQVHKETLAVIENALPNRSGLEVEIFGMEGIPEDVVQAHQQRVLQQFAQAEAERRAATGNAGPGGAGVNQPKKAKFEAPSDLKKRLAEHKAKKVQEDATGLNSGGNTPSGMAQGSQSPGLSNSPGVYAGSPSFSQPPQISYGAPPNNPGYASYPQSYGQQPPPFQQQQSPFPPQQSPFSPPGPPQFPNNQGFAPPQQFQPPVGQGFQSNFQNGPPPNFQNGPPQFQNGPPPQFQNGPLQFQNGPQQFQNGPPQFQNGPPQQFPNNAHQFQNGPPQQYGPGSPAPLLQHSQLQPPQIQNLPQRPGNLPAAPGLPQRPSFGAPPVNAFQMQQMHQGQMAGPPNPIDHSYNSQQSLQQVSEKAGSQGVGLGAPSAKLEEPNGKVSNLNDMVSSAAKDADRATTAAASTELKKVQEPQEEKKSKKDKEKNMKLMYSDNEVSPEEKMAKMARYAFAPSG